MPPLVVETSRGFVGTWDRFWLNLQAAYDLDLERDRLGSAGARSTDLRESRLRDGAGGQPLADRCLQQTGRLWKRLRRNGGTPPATEAEALGCTQAMRFHTPSWSRLRGLAASSSSRNVQAGKAAHGLAVESERVT